MTIENPTIYISFSLFRYLSDINIKKQEYAEMWKEHDANTNEYENIINIDSHDNICIYKPVSNLYFKLIELTQSVRFNFKDYAPNDFVMFSLGENPYHAIEPISNLRTNTNDKYYEISTSKIETSVDWVLKPDIPYAFETPEFLRDISEKYKNTANLVFCEDGNSLTPEFIKNEQLFFKITTAVCIQAKGGCLIMKLTDCFHKTTTDIVYILSSMYEKTYILKPSISQQSNSERFLVCYNFLFSNYKDYSVPFERALEKIYKKQTNETVSSFLSNSQIPVFFKTKIEECNAIIGQQQLETIHNIFGFIENKSVCEYNRKANIKKCILWCEKYGFEHNQKDNVNSLKPNIFRQSNV
jgi:hypothetical protein